MSKPKPHAKLVKHLRTEARACEKDAASLLRTAARFCRGADAEDVAMPIINDAILKIGERRGLLNAASDLEEGCHE